jgi:hypothetical protein
VDIGKAEKSRRDVRRADWTEADTAPKWGAKPTPERPELEGVGQCWRRGRDDSVLKRKEGVGGLRGGSYRF